MPNTEYIRGLSAKQGAGAEREPRAENLLPRSCWHDTDRGRSPRAAAQLLEAAAGHPFHGPYHDAEYGFPLREDDTLFGRLVLEINQAGLSWLTILKRREGFRRAYDGFRIERVAAYGDADRERLLQDSGIIRNRLKVNAAIENARRILALREEHGSFAGWLDTHRPLSRGEWQKLFKRTFVFTGGEIVGEFLLSTGYLPGAHRKSCPSYAPSWRSTRPGCVPPRGAERTTMAERHGAPGGVLTPEQLLARYPTGAQALAERLRTLVRTALGEPEERVYAGWQALGYHDAQAGYVCGIFPRRGEVRLVFEHGASLADPDGILTGAGTQTRNVVLRPGEQIPEAAIHAMIERAVLHGSVR